MYMSANYLVFTGLRATGFYFLVLIAYFSSERTSYFLFFFVS